MIIFVTGTDTGVGKTVIAGALALWAAKSGVRVSVLKPVETGCEGDPPRARDAEVLARCAGQDPESCAVYRLRAPLAPAVAAEREGTHVQIGRLLERIELLSEGSEIVVVEGAGGLRVPITWDVDYLDLAERLQAEVVLVARAGLGTLNHTRLSLSALRDRRLRVRGVVLNASTPDRGLAEATNEATLRRLEPGLRIGSVPHILASEEYARCLVVAESIGWLWS